MRACQATSAKAVSMPDLVKDVAELRGALQGELATIAAAAAAGAGGGRGGWGGNALWLGADEAEAAATALLPKLAAAREATQALLFEVVALEVCGRPPLFLGSLPPAPLCVTAAVARLLSAWALGAGTPSC